MKVGMQNENKLSGDMGERQCETFLSTFYIAAQLLSFWTLFL